MVKTCLACLAMVAVVGSASADTVAWWRFGDLGSDGGKAGADTVFTNLVDGSRFAARACSFKDQKGPGTDADYLPSTVNAFGEWSGLKVKDPVSGTTHAARCALHCPWGGDDSGLSGGAVVEADPALWGVKDNKQGDFTFECFIKTTQAGNSRTAKMQPIAGMPNPGGSFGGWSIIIYQGMLWARCSYYREDGSYTYDSIGQKGGVTPDVWHHVAIVFAASESKFQLYLDYKPQGSYSFKGKPNATDAVAVKKNGYLYLGKGTYENDRSLDGDIAEARLSDAALGPDQFLCLSESGAGDRNPADPDTLVWFSMDSLTSGFGSGFLSANPQLQVHGAEGYSGSLLCPDDGTAPAQTNDVLSVDRLVREAAIGERSAREIANEGSMLFSSPNGETNAYVEILEPTPVTSGSFTLEFFFKTARKVVSDGKLTSSMGLAASSNLKIMINQANGRLFFRPEFTDGVDRGNSFGNRRVDDGQWHHVAIVYDKDALRTSLFLDGGSIVSWTGLTLKEQTGYPLAVGRARNSFDLTQNFDGQIDEVRLTARALTSEEFLACGRSVGNMLVNIPLDGDAMLYPYGMSGTASAYVSGTTQLPTHIAEGRCEEIMTGRDYATLRQNRGACRFEGGAVTYPHIAALDRADITVEFFWRPFGKGAPWPCPLGLSRNEGQYASTKAPWMFHYAGTWDYSQLCLRFNTSDAAGGAHASDMLVSPKYSFGDGPGTSAKPGWKNANYDGRWHHVAATFAETVTDGGATTNTTVTTYFDYQQRTQATLAGALVRCATSGLVMQPGDSSESRLCTWDLDEVRITAGVLTPEQFCRPGPKGMLLIVR